MKTVALISVDEYLASHYDPDCDYVDGEVRERNVGEQDHSRMQTLLCLYLGQREKQWNVRVFTEQRVQVKPTRFRIPDLCAVAGRRPAEQVFTRPPLLCVEILSPDDTLESIQERIDDYLAFGVACVWVISPRTRRGWIYTLDSIAEAKDGTMRVTGTEIEVPLVELFDNED